VVIPVFNEEATLQSVVDRVRRTEYPCEIILVDDGSTDHTPEILQQLNQQPGIRSVRHEANRGKGAALRTGFSLAKGDVVVVQDADLEYDPQDYEGLIEPIVSGAADVVYGSRYGPTCRASDGVWHRQVNRLITWLSNRMTGLSLSDVETGYKVFRREVLEQLAPQLIENGFGVEVEMTSRLARLSGVRIVERPVRYAGRGYAEGKKVGWRDGLRALWCILRY
jgi:glycosyltransferase involved in cell wall biosynthesis